LGAVFGKLALALADRDLGRKRLLLPPPTPDQISAVRSELVDADVLVDLPVTRTSEERRLESAVTTLT
jgi:hypothetical protein